MDNHEQRCESCGMPIETGSYCQHCVDEHGKLQAFEDRFERMVQWQLKQNPNAARPQAERETLAHMAKMPAWRDHPDLLARSRSQQAQRSKTEDTPPAH